MINPPPQLDVFEAAFQEVKRAIPQNVAPGRIRLGDEKGLNTKVLATTAYMLLVGVGRLNLGTLKSSKLDSVVQKLDYSEFDVYVKYLMGKKKESTSADYKKTYNNYVATIVRYIYKLKALGAEYVPEN